MTLFNYLVKKAFYLLINDVILIIGDNMRYLVKIGELGEKIDYLEKQLSIIDENINYLKSIKNNIIWEGTASLKFNEYYDNYLKELSIIEKTITSYIKYLATFYNNYSNEYLRIRQKYTNLANRRV